MKRCNLVLNFAAGRLFVNGQATDQECGRRGARLGRILGLPRECHGALGGELQLSV